MQKVGAWFLILNGVIVFYGRKTCTYLPFTGDRISGGYEHSMVGILNPSGSS